MPPTPAAPRAYDPLVMDALPAAPDAPAAPVSGLTEAEAAARLAEDGPNELARPCARSRLATFAHVLK